MTKRPHGDHVAQPASPEPAPPSVTCPHGRVLRWTFNTAPSLGEARANPTMDWCLDCEYDVLVYLRLSRPTISGQPDSVLS